MDSPVLEHDASPELVAQVKRIEDQSDKWAASLALADFTHDVAVWGVLVEVIDLIEQQIENHGHGSQEQREAMMNLGRASALLIDRLRKANLPVKAVWLRWTLELREASRQAILAAHNYETFVSCFKMWHKNRMTVEVLASTRIRFSVPPSPMDRRIKAHQQGARIPDWPATPDNPVEKSLVDDPEVNRLLAPLWNKVTLEGALAMRYPDDSELLSVLRDIYNTRLQLAFRRDPLLDLGGYDLTVFRRFFAVLLSACTVHEYLCDLWSKARGQYPFESAVMARSSKEWIGLIARLSGVNEELVGMIVTDLTFGSIRPLDIYIHPFVPSLDGQILFLVPHIVLNSRPEENILRVCSYARPQFYSVIANSKEREMRDSIREKAPVRYRVTGPLKLPDPELPDIDLVIEDAETSSLLISELKWPRKTIRVLEHLDRDAELEKGFQQLRDVRAFLERCPDYLQQLGVIGAGNQRPNMSYAVISRDHLTYIPQQDGLWLAEFDALIWALRNSDNLAEALRKLKTYEWLPVEGREFTVQFEPTSVTGVTIDAEVFHRKSSREPETAPV